MEKWRVVWIGIGWGVRRLVIRWRVWVVVVVDRRKVYDGRRCGDRLWYRR